MAEQQCVIFMEELYNDLEFWYPKLRLLEAGVQVQVAGPEKGKSYHSKYGLPALTDLSFSEVNISRTDCIIVPGGYAPDKIRRSSHALDAVRGVFEKNGLIAFICHAGWVPISAGIVKGRKVTSYNAIKDDLVNAGATWVDEEVVVDGNLISSRTPDDLPALCRAILAWLSE